MGTKSWVAEFYPVEAYKVPKEEAVSHSLQKWKGLTEESLVKHGLNYRLPIEVSAATCALCRVNWDSCKLCPIKEHTGRACSSYTDESESLTPWQSWTTDKDPRPMINLLQTLKDREDEQSNPST